MHTVQNRISDKIPKKVLVGPDRCLDTKSSEIVRDIVLNFNYVERVHSSRTSTAPRCLRDMYNVSQFPVVWQHTFVQRTAEAFVEKGSAGFLVACMENVCFLVVQDSWMRCSNGRVTVRNWMKSSRLYREDIGSQLFVLQCDASGAVYVQRAFDFLALFKNVAAPKRPISFGDRNRGIDCICHIQYR
jgi:hypothetical protein